ncbi:acetolactate synthase, large subunit [Lachnospiraceae bacterium C7]|nr:acetolactate synthase, large subunit [Lachnospiraceae bacterium C7]
MKVTGAEVVIQCLKEQGVDTIFGYPGGAILNVYDALYKHEEIHHVLTSHEQGAAHAADGYARATGKVGVCFATSGPGATNLVTGIATAYMDSIPVVAITCNVNVPLLGKDSFQEIDITGITMPITKHNFIVKDVKNLATTIRRAFSIAKTGRPGPVLVDIAKDVTGAEVDYDFIPQKKTTKKDNDILSRVHRVKSDGTKEEIKIESTVISNRELEDAIKLIKAADKPFVFVGGGAILADADKELAEFVEKIDAPVCDSLMGKGAYDGTKENYTGMLGMHGTKASNLGVSECDLLIAIGVRFSDRVMGNPKKFAQNAKILQFDIDPAEINKNIKVDSAVIGDVKVILQEINKKLDTHQHNEWIKHIEEYKEKFPLSYPKVGLSGPYLVEKLYEKTKGEAIIVTEVGQHQMWAAQYYKYKKPHTFLSSGGLGTMGYGLGASIGAQTAKKDTQVVNIAGDGCFRMNMNEIATASREKLPLIQIIVNNHVLGMVRQWQTLFYEKRYSATVLDDGVDYVAIAKAMGAEASRVTTREEYEKALDEALKSKKPYVIDCIINSDDKVWPMVAPGAPISEVFDESDIKNSK